MHLSSTKARCEMLLLLGIQSHLLSEESAEAELRKNYGLGSRSAVVLWQDVCDLSGELRLEESEISMSGFTDFAKSVYAIHNCQKHGSRQGCRGKWFWRIGKLKTLSPLKENHSENGPASIGIVAIDGIDIMSMENLAIDDKVDMPPLVKRERL